MSGRLPAKGALDEREQTDGPGYELRGLASSTVAGALERLQGVDTVEASLETKLVTVRHRSEISLEALVTVVEDRGYEVAEAA